jgi:hypothetical protein
MNTYIITSDLGDRQWAADNAEHAEEQHALAFPDEPIISTVLVGPWDNEDEGEHTESDC